MDEAECKYIVAAVNEKIERDRSAYSPSALAEDDGEVLDLDAKDDRMQP